MAKISINIATGSLQKEEIIVGIDLGTTNSLIAILHPETSQAVALKEHNSSSLVPSIVHFDEQGNVTVGEEAKQYLISEPQNTIFSAKRLMGKSYNDIKNNSSFFTYKIIDDNTESLVKVQVGKKFYSPVELSSFILKELKPWRILLVFLFGLIHGMGFASSLNEIGLPPGKFFTSILMFNVGVEVCQVCIIAVLFTLIISPFKNKAWYRYRIVYPISVAIAIISSYWTIERLMG